MLALIANFTLLKYKYKLLKVFKLNFQGSLKKIIYYSNITNVSSFYLYLKYMKYFIIKNLIKFL